MAVMKKMIMSPSAVLICVGFFVPGAGASAQEAATLPTFAQTSSPWAGWSVGTEFISIFAKGSKSHAGADGFIAYNRQMDAHWSIGLSASAGYMPYSWANAPFKGVDFAMTEVKVGYQMGQWKPYVTAGLAMSKFDAHGSPDIDSSLNSLFSSSGGLKGAAMVGAGVDYQINERWSVGVGVAVGNGPALLAH